jgi:hypothetical protein
LEILAFATSGISIPAAQRKALENLSDLVTNGDELAKLGGKLLLATERIQ